jgi:hypothetical protein
MEENYFDQLLTKLNTLQKEALWYNLNEFRCDNNLSQEAEQLNLSLIMKVTESIENGK